MSIVNRIAPRSTLLLLVTLLCAPLSSFAASAGERVNGAQGYVEHALDAATAGKLDEAERHYRDFTARWRQIEDDVKAQSGRAYRDIESAMGKVSYALIERRQQGIVDALRELHAVDAQFVAGHYRGDAPLATADLTLAQFVERLEATERAADRGDRDTAREGISALRESWLGVEGAVVARSASAYEAAETGLVTADAMIRDGELAGAARVLRELADELSPIAELTAYSAWDAAMIPLREGLEALLVVGALLAFTRKADSRRGTRWIWYGVGAGVLVSAILAVVVKVLFSSAAFGTNNALIAGWTGVGAAAMLLYVSYWLHSKSSLAEWNRYIAARGAGALATGSLASLALLSFLAVFREGTETVLFIIGMVNQISVEQLVVGLLAGSGVLAVVAWLMLYLGVRLPIRAFFMVSSLIVLYLCLKFTGTGIHSLQLAGAIPSDLLPGLPSIGAIGFFPSLQSAVPQLLIVVLAVSVVVWNQLRRVGSRPLSLEREGVRE